MQIRISPDFCIAFLFSLFLHRTSCLFRSAIQYFHKLIAGDGFVFIEIFCNIMKLHDILLQNSSFFLMLCPYKFNYLFINVGCCLIGAGKGCVSTQILVADMLKSHHIKLI